MEEDLMVIVAVLVLIVLAMWFLPGTPAGYALAAIGVAAFAYAMTTRTLPGDIERKIQW